MATVLERPDLDESDIYIPKVWVVVRDHVAEDLEVCHSPAAAYRALDYWQKRRIACHIEER